MAPKRANGSETLFEHTKLAGVPFSGIPSHLFIQRKPGTLVIPYRTCKGMGVFFFVELAPLFVDDTDGKPTGNPKQILGDPTLKK